MFRRSPLAVRSLRRLVITYLRLLVGVALCLAIASVVLFRVREAQLSHAAAVGCLVLSASVVMTAWAIKSARAGRCS